MSGVRMNGISAQQYAQLMQSYVSGNRICAERNELQALTYRCFARDQLSSQRVPLTLRQITIFGRSYKNELMDTPEDALMVGVQLERMASHKRINDQKRNRFIQFIFMICDYVRNLFTGYGFISTYTMTMRLAKELKDNALKKGYTANEDEGNIRSPNNSSTPPLMPNNLRDEDSLRLTGSEARVNSDLSRTVLEEPKWSEFDFDDESSFALNSEEERFIFSEVPEEVDTECAWINSRGSMTLEELEKNKLESVILQKAKDILTSSSYFDSDFNVEETFKDNEETLIGPVEVAGEDAEVVLSDVISTEVEQIPSQELQGFEGVVSEVKKALRNTPSDEAALVVVNWLIEQPQFDSQLCINLLEVLMQAEMELPLEESAVRAQLLAYLGHWDYFTESEPLAQYLLSNGIKAFYVS